MHKWCIFPDGESRGAALQQLVELRGGEDAAMIYQFNLSSAHNQVCLTLRIGKSNYFCTNRHVWYQEAK